MFLQNAFKYKYKRYGFRQKVKKLEIEDFFRKFHN